MKLNTSHISFALAGAVFFIAATSNRAQPTPFGQGDVIGHATDFTSLTYFEPPDQQKVKMKLSGTEASPLPGGLLDVKRLKMEMFNLTNVNPVVVVQAPQCTYAPLDGVANSSGHLQVLAMDGKVRLEGEGFLWQQTNSLLTISNRVRTTIEVNIFADKKAAL